MKSWLPPNVPMEIWQSGHVLHAERMDAADCRGKYVMGSGDTHAYVFTTDRVGMVIGVEVWCDGLLETTWERVPRDNPHDVQWRKVI